MKTYHEDETVNCHLCQEATPRIEAHYYDEGIFCQKCYDERIVMCKCGEVIKQEEAFLGEEFNEVCQECYEADHRQCDICGDMFPLTELEPHGEDTGVDPAGWICEDCNQKESDVE